MIYSDDHTSEDIISAFHKLTLVDIPGKKELRDGRNVGSVVKAREGLKKAAGQLF